MPSRKQKNKKNQHKQHVGQQNSQLKTKEAPNGHTIPAALETQLPYEVKNSEIYGRYLVASRDLKPGELLINEKPLAIGPCVSADAVCLGCYKPVEIKTTQYRCPSCNWPLCGANCAGLHKLHGHTAYECEMLTKFKANAGNLLTPQSALVDIKNIYELILIARILLSRVHTPENYESIQLMESHNEMRRQNSELWQHYQRNVVERLRNDWGFMEFSELDIHTVCGIVDVNCFEIGQNGAKARTLYGGAFLLAHDCSPNTSHTDVPETFELLLRTSQGIKKGEAITLSYAYTLQGTLKRREFMYAGKLFWCTCKRCSDPRELGTDCSDIVCAKCEKGAVRSMDPLNQESDWNCDKCDFLLSAKNVISLLDKINDDLETIDVHDVPGLENFIKRYQKALGPNHYLLLSAKYSLCQIYGRIAGYLLPQMSVEDIKRKEKYCREFLEIIDVLEPQLTRLRGLIMYELHAPVLVSAQYSLQNQSINRREFGNHLREVMKLLRASRDILLMEPAGSAEHQMGLAAADALENMQST